MGYEPEELEESVDVGSKATDENDDKETEEVAV